MKLLAFSDLHRNKKIAEQIVAQADSADILIGAGDFATAATGEHETLDILKHAQKPTLIVPGNHDAPETLQSLCAGWSNFYYLHGTGVEIGGKAFFGLGMEIPNRGKATWNAALSEAEAAEYLLQCPENAILITHTPPFGHADLQSDGRHEGSQSIAEAARLKSPKLLLCGHIHNAWGMTSNIGATRIVNLGPTLNWFDLP